MKTAKQVLLEAANLIEPEGRHSKEFYARDADGLSVDPKSSEACCWCAFGAIDMAAQGQLDVLFSAEDTLARVCGDVAEFNDTHTQAQVVAKLREAAELVNF